jgi:hypothetical protein
MSHPMQRRLAAILAADIAGYSRLMGENEETPSFARALRSHLLRGLYFRPQRFQHDNC